MSNPMTPAEQAAAALFAPACIHEPGEPCDECEDRARNFVATVQGPIAAAALREFADGHRFPNHWIMFRRNDGTGVTVSDLLRETAARHEGTTQ